MRRQLHDLPLLALTLAAVGCGGNKIRGEIDNQAIDVKSAFFFAQPAVLGADSLIGVVLTDLPKGCQDYGFYLTANQGVIDPAGLATNWAAVFPPEFWEVTLLLRTGDPAVALTGQTLQGIPWDGQLDAVGKAQGFFTHNLLLRDAAYYDGSGDVALYRQDYLSNGGQMEIDKHVPGTSIKGRFATYTVDADDGTVPTGLLEISFDADFCPTADMLDSSVGADGG